MIKIKKIDYLFWIYLLSLMIFCVEKLIYLIKFYDNSYTFKSNSRIEGTENLIKQKQKELEKAYKNRKLYNSLGVLEVINIWLLIFTIFAMVIKGLFNDRWFMFMNLWLILVAAI